MIARLVIVTVALAILTLVVRRKAGRTARPHQLRVTARTALHRNAVLAVVEIEGRRLLIGAGTQQIQLITELESAPEQGGGHRRPERPSELPAVPDETVSLIERARRATSRTLDPAVVAQHRARQASAAAAAAAAATTGVPAPPDLTADPQHLTESVT